MNFYRRPVKKGVAARQISFPDFSITLEGPTRRKNQFRGVCSQKNFLFFLEQLILEIEVKRLLKLLHQKCLNTKSRTNVFCSSIITVIYFISQKIEK